MLSSLPRQSLDTVHWYNSPSTACWWARPGLPLTSGSHEGQLWKESSLRTQVTCLLCSLLCAKESNPGPPLSLAQKHITPTTTINTELTVKGHKGWDPRDHRQWTHEFFFRIHHCVLALLTATHVVATEVLTPGLTFCYKNRSLWALPFPVPRLASLLASFVCTFTYLISSC